MLKNSRQAGGGSDVSVSTNPGPGSPVALETPKPRKKLSFKEPEILNYLRSKKPFSKPRPPPLQLARSAANVDFSFDENPFEEENDDLEELEVYVQAQACIRAFGRQRGYRPFTGVQGLRVARRAYHEKASSRNRRRRGGNTVSRRNKLWIVLDARTLLLFPTFV